MEDVFYHQRGKDALYKIWHTTGRPMLICMHSSGGSLICSERTYPIERGVLCFVGADALHYTMPQDPERYDRSKLFLSREDFHVLKNFLRMPQQFAQDRVVCTQLDMETLREADHLFADASHHAAPAVRLSCFLRLMACLEQEAQCTPARPADELSAAIEYINTHISEPLTIDSISEAVHISKYHFCRRFKKASGLTVMEYVLQTRLTLARNLLSRKEFSVTAISERCGFSSPSYFCRAFRTFTGQSPLRYRRSVSG